MLLILFAVVFFMTSPGVRQFISVLLAMPLKILFPPSYAAGGANAEPRRCGGWQLPLLSGRQGPQQELYNNAQGFLSMCVAHPEHG